ncbi:hypothetical protein EYC84_006370 [Monilinia fructicola]|uniref:G-patch domain-containing protein n=1 Tax=Monilinia fructicola TaxID=38448 RepID=A0A5M9K344_MONFR|nr:hypothetical protein EYC84_006370 [Monilinia fructicola]
MSAPLKSTKSSRPFFSISRYHHIIVKISRPPFCNPSPPHLISPRRWVLSAPKNKIKLSHDPNNTRWSGNTDSFGHRMMKSQGWTPGEIWARRMPRIAEFHTAANASHIRVVVKDNNLGLGAKVGSGVGHGECTGLDVFQNLLGRLNGKEEAEIEKEQKSRDDLKRAIYAERKWGKRVKALEVKGKSTEKDSSSEESDSSSDEGEKTSEPVAEKKKSSKRKRDEQDGEEKSSSKKSKKEKKSKKRKSEDEDEDDKDKAESKKSKKSKKNRKSKSKSTSESESETPDDAAMKARKREKKEKKRREKEAAAAGADTEDTSSTSKSSEEIKEG